MRQSSGSVIPIEVCVGDLDEIDPIVRENLTFIPCRKAGEVLAAALVLPDKLSAAPSAEVSEGLNLPEVTVRPSANL